MMKRLMLFAVVIATVTLIQGCASTQVAKDNDLSNENLSVTKTNVAHIYGTNWGLYCCSIPIVSGCTEYPGKIAWGKDTVNVPAVVKMITSKAQGLGGTSTLDIRSSASNYWIFPTFVLFIRSVEVSGNAIK